MLYDQTDTPVAAARLILNLPEKGVATFGRIVVKKAMRGRDLGRLLLEELEAKAKACGMRAAHLGAQLQAQRFYEKCGFVSDGGRYDEEGCPHTPMDKML